MNTKRRTVITILVALLSLTAVFFASACRNTGTKGLKYYLSGTEQVVNGYEGTNKKVVIPKEWEGYPVTYISKEAFKDCTVITSIALPDSIAYIDNTAFTGCINLESITVSKDNPVYHSAGNCIIETSTNKLIIGCKNSIIPDDGSVTSIGDNAFWGCTALKNIKIPAGVTSIGRYAFKGCTSLDKLEFSNGITSIEWFAFDECLNIRTLTIPESLTYIATGTFNKCLNLDTVYWNAANCSSSLNSSYYVFGGCSNFKTLIFGEKVQAIGKCVFDNCTYLKSVTIPVGVTSVGSYAFNGCKRLSDVYYGGTREQWEQIAIDDKNTYLAAATIHFNSN